MKTIVVVDPENEERNQSSHQSLQRVVWFFVKPRSRCLPMMPSGFFRSKEFFFFFNSCWIEEKNGFQIALGLGKHRRRNKNRKWNIYCHTWLGRFVEPYLPHLGFYKGIRFIQKGCRQISSSFQPWRFACFGICPELKGTLILNVFPSFWFVMHIPFCSFYCCCYVVFVPAVFLCLSYFCIYFNIFIYTLNTCNYTSHCTRSTGCQ